MLLLKNRINCWLREIRLVGFFLLIYYYYYYFVNCCQFDVVVVVVSYVSVVFFSSSSMYNYLRFTSVKVKSKDLLLTICQQFSITQNRHLVYILVFIKMVVLKLGFLYNMRSVARQDWLQFFLLQFLSIYIIV